ncbi:MAG: ATP synthase F1 subunit gamma [Deltaproteobacteria bacterium]|nr:ATP synthase F1 subunit gamma [Deltaproteobacteria bacterium]
MATLKDIQRKIAVVKKTQQITRAMKMVATSKLRGAQEATERFRPYADKFQAVLASLASGVEPEMHPFFQARENVARIGLTFLTADRGLCGSFNTNLANKVQAFINEKKAEGAETVLLAGGRKGRDYFSRRGYDLHKVYLDVLGKPDFDLAQQVAAEASDLFLTGEVDEVYIVFSRFFNISRQAPTVMKLLPFSPEDLTGEEEADQTKGEYLVEPSAGEVMIELLPKNVTVQVLSALLETACSEQAARMTAMDNATSNCSDMIENLTLVFNKARQAAITAELMDIVGGAEALK